MVWQLDWFLWLPLSPSPDFAIRAVLLSAPRFLSASIFALSIASSKVAGVAPNFLCCWLNEVSQEEKAGPIRGGPPSQAPVGGSKMHRPLYTARSRGLPRLDTKTIPYVAGRSW
jgi:hypothetical protein